MSRFEFDPTPSAGTNRSATVTDCETCGGDRMVRAENGEDREVYYRCPTCNPAPDREPVAEDAWWKQ